ncbi:MAG: hypothetical protein U9Q03_03185 [Patescibacteria group bacterium]|nr:hypothetical protein [Patescibacteria group bacterium]
MSVLSLLSLRNEAWLSGWALIHALPNHAFAKGDPYFDVEDAITSLEENGHIETRITKRDMDMRPEKDIDWRNMMFRITAKGRVSLEDSLH